MGRRKLVRILLEAGLSPTDDGEDSVKTNTEALNLQHERAADIAQRKEHLDIVEMFKNPPSANPSTTKKISFLDDNENAEGVELDGIGNNKGKKAKENNVAGTSSKKNDKDNKSSKKVK